MNDFEDFLSNQLADHARTLPTHDGGLTTITRRGLQRRSRRRRAVVGSGLVTASIATVGAITVLNNDTTLTIDEQAAADSLSNGDDTVVPSTAVAQVWDRVPPVEPMTPVESSLVWNRVDPASAESLGFGGAIFGSGPFYSISTSPGRTTDSVTTLYRSADARTWQPAAMPGISLATPQSITASGNELYAVGTAPGARAGEIDAVMSTSIDGGDTWTQSILDVGLEELRADPLVATAGATPSAVRTKDGLVIAVRLNVNLDFAAFVPGWPNLFGGINVTEDGVELFETPLYGACDRLAPTTTIANADLTSVPTEPAVSSSEQNGGQCVDERGRPTLFTWADIGASDATRESLLHPVRIWHSTDGRTFKAAVVPDLGSGLVSSLVTTSLGVGYALVYERAAPSDESSMSTVLASPDGITWTANQTPARGIRQIGSDGDSLVLVTDGNSAIGNLYTPRTTLWTSSDLTTWTSATLQGLLSDADGPGASLNVLSFGFDDSGMSAVGQVFVDPTMTASGVVLTKNGLTMRLRNQWQFVEFSIEETGEVIGAIDNTQMSPDAVPPGIGTAQTNEGFAVIDPRSGSRVMFGFEEVNAAVVAATAPYRNPRVIILHSADGVNWSREWADELAGTDIGGVNQVAVNGTQVVVSVSEQRSIEEQQGDEPPTPILLIGTPKG